uniref:Uncharacterized protein n=1 Tax=Lactuca sativa TaxID=4236 RepID=A0A9R1UXE0_LACSA|nr:hypothetical protein LSAT_V11C800421570 [Lactuca sativa]
MDLDINPTIMVELRNYDTEAYQWLMKVHPHHWARSHFSSPLTPNGTRILEAITTLDSKYHARWNREQKYQVQVPWNDQHVVGMGKKSVLAENGSLL